jgi:archaellum component FlaC
MPRSRRALAAVLLAVLLALAGCSGASSGGGASADVAATAGVERSGGAAGGDAAGGESGNAYQIQQRQVIRTGRVALTVDDYGRARQNLTRAARGMDGYVSDSSQRRHDVDGGAYVTGSVTLRVPQERFGAMMDRAESMGTVRNSETSSRDVTDQLVDIEARLENLRSERERLRTLYEQANDTEAVLAVQRRLSETQQEIERLEAQQRSLERQVTYSTITVELNEERPEPGPDAVQQWYDVPLVGAFLESVHGVVVALRALAVLVAYALPYLLVFLGPVALVGGLAVRRYRRGEDGPGDDGQSDGGEGDGPADGGADAPPDDGGLADSGEDDRATASEDDGSTDGDENLPPTDG